MPSRHKSALFEAWIMKVNSLYCKVTSSRPVYYSVLNSFKTVWIFLNVLLTETKIQIVIKYYHLYLFLLQHRTWTVATSLVPTILWKCRVIFDIFEWIILFLINVCQHNPIAGITIAYKLQPLLSFALLLASEFFRKCILLGY